MHSSKVVFNLADQFDTKNNCGFNLANFTPRLIRDYFSEVIYDYERSFIGAFSSIIFEMMKQSSNQNEDNIFLSITKYSNDFAISLTNNQRQKTHE